MAEGRSTSVVAPGNVHTDTIPGEEEALIAHAELLMREVDMCRHFGLGDEATRHAWVTKEASASAADHIARSAAPRAYNTGDGRLRDPWYLSRTVAVVLSDFVIGNLQTSLEILAPRLLKISSTLLSDDNEVDAES